MTVALISSIQRYIGLSTDRKPTDCVDASTFLEKDTGDLYTFTVEDGVWHLKSEANVALRLETIRRHDDLLNELKTVNENLVLVIEALGG